MWFIAKDKRKIQIGDLVIMDDLSTYHNVISFTALGFLFTDEGRIETDAAKFDVHIENQVQTSNNQVKVECVTMDVYNAFNATTAGYTGRTTLNGLFAKLGFNYKSNYQSNNTYFSIPQCMVVSMFDKLTKYASFANGGGAHFFMNVKGDVNGYDYKLIKEKAKAVNMFAEINGRSFKTDWINFNPSEYDINYWDNNNKFKKDTLKTIKGHGKAILNVNDTTGEYYNAVKQEIVNNFYNKWFTSYILNVTLLATNNPQNFKVGDLIYLNNNKEDTYIIKALTIGYSEAQQVGSFGATLVSEPKY